MSGRASGSCRCSTRCWARYQPLERRPWSSPTGCPPAKWCPWLQSQLFRQILSPFFMPKNDGIPFLPISRCFFNVPSFQPRHRRKGSSECRRSSEAYRSTAWRSVHCMGRCIRTNARKPMRPSKEQAPRRAAEGLGPLKVQIRLHQAGDDGSRQFLMPEGVEKLPFFLWVGCSGNTGTHDKISKLQGTGTGHWLGVLMYGDLLQLLDLYGFVKSKNPWGCESICGGNMWRQSKDSKVGP